MASTIPTSSPRWRRALVWLVRASLAPPDAGSRRDDDTVFQTRAAQARTAVRPSAPPSPPNA